MTSKDELRAAFFAGFRSSNEGWNGETSSLPPNFSCPPDDHPEQVESFEHWLATGEVRDD